MTKPKQIMYSNRLLFLVILIFMLNCGDSLNITGITETDETGPDPIGNIDENDWCPPQHSGTGEVIRIEDGLYPAYPNPTNNGTILLFEIGQSTRVKLQIINKHKKVVRLLVDEIKNAGLFTVQWNLRDENGEKVKNGFYRVQFFIDGEFKCHGDIQVIK